MVGGIDGVTLEQMKRFPRYVQSVCNKEYGKTTCIGRWTAVGEDPAVQQCSPDKIDASKLCDKKYICTPFINTLTYTLKKNRVRVAGADRMKLQEQLVIKDLLKKNPDPTEEDIRWAISGNLCRCTGYQNIVKAALSAAAKQRESAAAK